MHCAVLLLKKGYDVTVFEQHATVGGLAAGFKRKGYYFDSGLARFAADSLAGYFQEAGMKDRVHFQSHSASLRIMDKTYQTRSVSDFIAACAESFPAEAEAIYRFYREKIQKASRFMIIQNKAGPMSYKGLKLVVKMLKTMSKTLAGGNIGGVGALISSTNIELRGLLSEYFGEKSPAADFLYGITSDLFKKGGTTSLMTFIGSLCSCMELNRYPAGGFQHLCNLYADEIARLGGKILTSSKVIRVYCLNDKAAGVEYLHQGKMQREASDSVISAVDLNRLFLDLLKGNAANSGFVDVLKRQETTSAVPILYLGLKISSKVIKKRLGDAEELIFYPGQASKGQDMSFFENTPLILHSSSINNREHAPEGCSSIQIYLASPPKNWMNRWGTDPSGVEIHYARLKKAVMEQVLKHVRQIIPELADESFIEVCELGTPMTFERFTGNKDGAHSGFTWDRSRNTINPEMGRCDVRPGSVSSLYAIGHWTGYLGGVTNAFASARQVANELK